MLAKPILEVRETAARGKYPDRKSCLVLSHYRHVIDTDMCVTC